MKLSFDTVNDSKCSQIFSGGRFSGRNLLPAINSESSSRFIGALDTLELAPHDDESKSEPVPFQSGMIPHETKVYKSLQVIFVVEKTPKSKLYNLGQLWTTLDKVLAIPSGLVVIDCSSPQAKKLDSFVVIY